MHLIEGIGIRVHHSRIQVASTRRSLRPEKDVIPLGLDQSLLAEYTIGEEVEVINRRIALHRPWCSFRVPLVLLYPSFSDGLETQRRVNRDIPYFGSICKEYYTKDSYTRYKQQKNI